MKIVILGPAHPLRGGIAIYNERLARQFQNEGHEVTIYSFSLQYPGFLFPGTTQYSSEPAPSDLNIKIKVNSINPINWLAVGNEITVPPRQLVSMDPSGCSNIGAISTTSSNSSAWRILPTISDLE